MEINEGLGQVLDSALLKVEREYEELKRRRGGVGGGWNRNRGVVEDAGDSDRGV